MKRIHLSLLSAVLALTLALGGCAAQPGGTAASAPPGPTLPAETPVQAVPTPAPAAPASAEPSPPSAPVETAPAPTPEAVPGPMPEPARDQYLTDPVPEGKPEPVEPQDMAVGDDAYTCTLSVRCDTILENMDSLDPEKEELVPEDGVLFPETEVTFYEGESVFNILQREMKRAKVHMEFVNTPIYNSAYIEGIGNLYEFDCGELSGWMYKVDDWFPNYGCSRYQLQPGDKVEWVYTCDLGRDVGSGVDRLQGKEPE